MQLPVHLIHVIFGVALKNQFIRKVQRLGSMVSHFFQYKLKYSELKNYFYKTLAYARFRCILQNKLLIHYCLPICLFMDQFWKSGSGIRDFYCILKLISGVTLFFLRHMCLQTKKNVEGKEPPDPCPAGLCCCCWNKPCTHQCRNRKMHISTTLKRLCWQLQGTHLDKAEWIPGGHSGCHPPREINEVNNALKSIK